MCFVYIVNIQYIMNNAETSGLQRPCKPPELAPFREFILKNASRCNLACDYCYMYEMPDQSWVNQPLMMSDAVVQATAERISEHTNTHNLGRIAIIFHGGEPLLADQMGADFFPRTIQTFRDTIPASVSIDYAIQTNGTLLNRRRLEMLSALGVSVGVSLDGNELANDEHRKYRNGRGSYKDVVRGIELLQQYPNIYAGLLCTVNLANDPIETYEALSSFRPPGIDFLLPLGNWSLLPPNHDPTQPTTNYADWLIPIFDRWYEDSNAPAIRIFEEIQRLLLGQKSSIEYLGLTIPANVVIETDGSIAEVDTLKSAGVGAPDIGLNVFEHSFDDALKHPKTRERQMGKAALAADCLKCELVEVCGGGYYPHRYRNDGQVESFRNRSVYCADLMKLIGHIAARMTRDLQAALDR